MRFFDLHCDTLGRTLDVFNTGNKNANLVQNNFHVSLEKSRKYQPYLGCFAIWIPDEIRGNAAFELFNKAFKKLTNQSKKYPEYFKIIKNKSDLENAINSGKNGIIFTVEGGAAIAGDLKKIKYLKNCGVKIITLTWNGACEFGDGCGVQDAKGLTSFGIEAIKEMENQEIIVDVSHSSEAIFYDVAEYSKKPFIATHSNSKVQCPHTRNLTDDQFNVIKSSCGIVGITFCKDFLNDKKAAIFEDIHRHIEHFLALDGENIICIGSDFDGTDMPTGIIGVESVEDLYNYFLIKNYSEELVDKIFFKNAYNFICKFI